MSFNIHTCKWVIWGAKHPYNTFGHVHEAFLRALKYLGKDAQWLENDEDVSQIDFSNTLFLSMNCVVEGMPQRKDCFYVIHNIMGDPRMPYFEGLKLLPYGIHISTNRYSSQTVELAPQVFFDLANTPSLAMRWGTDQLPHEIETNKPLVPFNSSSRICNFIGSIDTMKKGYLDDFGRACRENGITYTYHGSHGGRVVLADEHIRLVKDSYICPAIQGRDQVEQGYVSCRLFKNISYGQMGVTCSTYANELFGGKLICNPDAYRLFYDARERLQSMSIGELHALMDEVATKHTYLNKIDGIVRAVQILGY